MARVDQYLPIPYRLKTVRIGLQATWLALGALLAYPLLPGAPEIDLAPYLILIGTAAAGASLIRILPWPKLFQTEWGIRCQYGWSVLDIILITGLVAVSGGANSYLFLLYVLTTVFFATSYRPSVQFWMLMITYAMYASALFLGDWQGNLAHPALQMIVLGVITSMTSFLSHELIAQGEELERETKDRLLAEEHLEAARERQGQALQLNDEIVQGLSVAKMALELGDTNVSQNALNDTLSAAKGIVSHLLEESAENGTVEGIDLVKNP